MRSHYYVFFTYLFIFLQNHFIEILDVMHGSARNIVNMHVLTKATRSVIEIIISLV